MKNNNIKVFTNHGFRGRPNKAWHPWLMTELNKASIYCASIVHKNPDSPKVEDWINEIDFNVKKFPKDKIILVGHSLGVPAILKFLQNKNPKNILGCVLVSGVYKQELENQDTVALRKFFGNFEWEKLKKLVGNCVVIHGEDDKMVNFKQAEFLTEKLGAKLIPIKKGGHLSDSEGWRKLPQALKSILEII